jgi:hypothetical protein
VRPGDLGENITTVGLDLECLPQGTLLRLGASATLELTGLRTPCVLIDRFKSGLQNRLQGKPAGPRFKARVMAIVTEVPRPETLAASFLHFLVVVPLFVGRQEDWNELVAALSDLASRLLEGHCCGSVRRRGSCSAANRPRTAGNTWASWSRSR